MTVLVDWWWHKTGGRLRAIGSTIKRNGSLSKTEKQRENQTDKLESSEDEIAENITDQVDQIRSDPH